MKSMKTLSCREIAAIDGGEAGAVKKTKFMKAAFDLGTKI